MEELSDWPARIRKTCWFHAGDGIIDGLRSRHDSTYPIHTSSEFSGSQQTALAL